MTENDWNIINNASIIALRNCSYTENLIHDIKSNLEEIVKDRNKNEKYDFEYYKFLLEMLESLIDKDIESVRMNDKILEALEGFH